MGFSLRDVMCVMMMFCFYCYAPSPRRVSCSFVDAFFVYFSPFYSLKYRLNALYGKFIELACFSTESDGS